MKKALREQMRLLRKQLNNDERTHSSNIISSKLLADNKITLASGIVAVYLASPQEISLSPFIEGMISRGKSLAAPRWNGKEYELAILSSLSESDLQIGPMNIAEPAKENAIVDPQDVAIWLVPGLVFDKKLKRIGYGGGWYDRLLCCANQKSLKLGICHSFQVLEEIPSEEHDITLDGLITDEEF
jgi:5-formyltetrahydrofolate cyclo-ligase